MIAEVFKAVFIALVVVVLVYELRFHALHRRDGTLTPLLRKRLHNRLLGLGFLSLSVFFLIAPTLFVFLGLGPMMHLLSYGMAFVSIFFVLILALRDLVVIGQIAREEERRAITETMEELQDKLSRLKRAEAMNETDGAQEHPGAHSRDSHPAHPHKNS